MVFMGWAGVENIKDLSRHSVDFTHVLCSRHLRMNNVKLLFAYCIQISVGMASINRESSILTKESSHYISEFSGIGKPYLTVPV